MPTSKSKSTATLRKNQEVEKRFQEIIADLSPEVREYVLAIKNKQKPNLSRKEIMKLPLSEVERSVILGTLLGDGSLKLHKGYANARLAFRHSVKQAEYFFKKVEYLNGISGNGCVVSQDSDDGGYGTNAKFRYSSKALPVLTTIWQFIGRNQKNIKRSWLNLLTEQSLAIWWCDDGSLGASKGREGVICTDGFSLEEHKILQQWLAQHWKLKVRILRVWRKQKAKEVEAGLVDYVPVGRNNLDDLEGRSDQSEADIIDVQEQEVLQSSNSATTTDLTPVVVDKVDDQGSSGSSKDSSNQPFDSKSFTESDDYLTRSKVAGKHYFYRLNFRTSELEKFLILICPYCPCESMLHKFFIRYNSTSNQQRWISQVKSRLPESLKAKCDPFLARLQEKITKGS